MGAYIVTKSMYGGKVIKDCDGLFITTTKTAMGIRDIELYDGDIVMVDGNRSRENFLMSHITPEGDTVFSNDKYNVHLIIEDE